MTSPPRLTDQLSTEQLGLTARALDVHRQALVRKLERIDSETERSKTLLEISDCREAADIFKRAEQERLSG